MSADQLTLSWNRLLDEIEADLAAVEAALDDHSALPEPTERSHPVGPFPGELAFRAELLLARTRRLEGRAEVDRDRIGTNLRALAGRHQPPERTRTGRLIDVIG